MPHIDLVYPKKDFFVGHEMRDGVWETLGALPQDSLSVHQEFDVLHRLLELLPLQYQVRPANRPENRIPEKLIALIVRTARAIVISEPNVVKVDPPVVICGDIHGQYYDLVNIFARRPPKGTDSFQRYLANGRSRQPDAKRARKEPNEGCNYLFLGDYVDRGSRSLEVMITLLSLKILSPSSITLLRGNHEDELVTMIYGFFDECKRRYSLQLFKIFSELFLCLPVAAVVGESIFCVHGGISPELDDVNQIPDTRPCSVPRSGIVCDLLWADPAHRMTGLFEPSSRNISFHFSDEALKKFLERNDLDLVCRAHQVVQNGFEFFPSPLERRLVTVFSATNYCNEFTNDGAMLCVDENMGCSILTLVPPTDEQSRELRLLN